MDDMTRPQLVDLDGDAHPPAALETVETSAPLQQNEDHPTITIDTSSPPASRPAASPRSPSALDAAEKFVLNSTKQLADWGEEAVAGVMKGSASFSLSKTAKTTDDDSQEKEILYSTQVKLQSQAPVVGGGGEEAERNKSLDRRVIREMRLAF